MTLVKHRHSDVSNKVPTVVQLQLGELAVNTYDGVIYTKKKVGTTETVEKFLPESLVYSLKQLTALITDTIPTGFIRVFASNNGYLYTKNGSNPCLKLLNSLDYDTLFYTLNLLMPKSISCSDDGNGITPVYFDELMGPATMIVSQSAAYSTLQLFGMNGDYQTNVSLLIQLSSGCKLRVPTDLSGFLCLSDDVWVWDNFNNTAKSVVEYVTGPPTYATFTCVHHGYTTGSFVKISGYSGNKAVYNGVHLLTSIDLNTFRIDVAYQASGTASSPTVVLQEKIFNIPDSNYIHIYDLINDVNYWGYTFITLKNKVKRY